MQMKDGCLLWEIQEASGPYLGKDAPLASTTALLVSTGIASDNLRHLVAGKHAYCVCCYAMSQRTYMCVYTIIIFGSGYL